MHQPASPERLGSIAVGTVTVLALSYFGYQSFMHVYRHAGFGAGRAAESGSFLSSGVAEGTGLESLSAAYRRNFDAALPGTLESGTTTFARSFNERAPALEEAGSILQSKSRDWWLNSGGRLIQNDGVLKTMRGEVPATDRWYREYRRTNPVDTDGGAHPQNIFRLVQLGYWTDFSQEAYFKIVRHHESQSPNRNASNGLLLFNRYQSGDNLYYAGVRVDGTAVVKKKLDGRYYTLAQTKVWDGRYDRTESSNLLPVETWIGLKSVVRNLPDGSVEVSLYTDVGRTGQWKLATRAVDSPGAFGDRVLKEGGFAGIRTDFMDVEFDDYKIAILPQAK